MPKILCEVPADSGPESPFYAWLAQTIGAMLPFIEKVAGKAEAEALDVDTLADRLRDETLARRSMVTASPNFLAWLRLEGAPAP